MNASQSVGGKNTESSVDERSHSLWWRARSTVAGSLCALFALLWSISIGATAVDALTAQEPTHNELNIFSWGAGTGIVLVGLLVCLVRRARDRPAAMLGWFAYAAGATIAGILVGDGLGYGIFPQLAAAVLVYVLVPGWHRAVWPRRIASYQLLAMSGVAVVAGIVLALSLRSGHIELLAGRTSLPVGFTTYFDTAVMAVTVPLVGVVSAFSVAGRQIVAVLVGVAGVTYGLGSLLLPDQIGSIGVLGGIAVMAYAAAWLWVCRQRPSLP